MKAVEDGSAEEGSVKNGGAEEGSVKNGGAENDGAEGSSAKDGGRGQQWQQLVVNRQTISFYYFSDPLWHRPHKLVETCLCPQDLPLFLQCHRPIQPLFTPVNPFSSIALTNEGLDNSRTAFDSQTF